MLQIPLWNRLLIVLVVLTGLTFAMPNFFYGQVERHNDAVATIEREGIETDELLADRAEWPEFLPSSLVNLGLDLRGGARLLAEVHVEEVYSQRMDSLWPQVRDELRELRDVVGTIRRIDAPDGELHVRISQPEGMASAVAAVRALAQPTVSLTGALGEPTLDVSGRGDTLIVRLSEAEQAATNDRTMQQSIEIVRRRVDEAGTREPTIQRQGADRILIEVPGIGSAQELKDLIGTTARLTFHPVVRLAGGAEDRVEARQIIVPSVTVVEDEQYYVLEQTPVLTGDDLTDSRPSFDQQTGRPVVTFQLNSRGGQAFCDYTQTNIGAPFAIVLDNEVLSAPTIQGAICAGSGQISGQFTVESSTELSILLRAGALPADLTFLQESTVGPELGEDSIRAGEVAALVAFAAVLLFMVASYGTFGVFASIALVLNVGLIFGVLSVIGATLTLPGIAGIVLTIGMAVDANVLVFERIREELRTARGPARAIELGYERALSAIIDANITTFIIATILFVLGSGPVRGFSVTLGIGILTSVFTAIYVTRLLVVIWFERRRPKTIEV
ncbi:protein translocase subunit SecD [Gymnodinialimonas sp. 2305UL16-5]|uniref:protein translocase subunit SecD n=1 Tax=Gymnodinialimonas mytili TaxID=3126503 RepID=UPI0030B2DB32